MKNKKYFCYEIFKNLSIWSRNGDVAYNPCSYYSGEYATSKFIDIEQAWTSSGKQKIINIINQDQPIPGCQSCYQVENNGLLSRRLGSQHAYENWHQNTNIDLSGPQGLDYSVGNLCNLKCVICNPENSSQWIPDYQKLYPEKNIEYLKYQKNNQLEITSDAALSNIISVHFHGGGEPLLNDAHSKLLTRIKSIKGLNDVRVFYNTNGTVVVSDEILKLWEECKLVELYFSVDDIDKRFEYQRTGANFEAVVKNLQWYYANAPHNYMFNINTTWSYLNLYYLDELVDWYRTNFLSNRYGDPTNLIFQKVIGTAEITHLSTSVKEHLLNKFNDYPELLKLVSSLNESDQSHDKFLTWIEQIDNIRNQRFSTVAPDWARILYDNFV